MSERIDLHVPSFGGHVATYRYLVRGSYVSINIDLAYDPKEDWNDRTWEFFDSEGTHLNGGEVWHVDMGDDDIEVPTYNVVYQCIVKPNYASE
jgi:hypothetical protein